MAMSNDRKLLERVEVFVNEQRADLAVVRFILQKFIARLVASSPATAEEQLTEMRTETLEAFARGLDDPRMRQMSIERAGQFFDELLGVLSKARSMTGEGGAKH
jgi:hypothetical protein